MNPEELVALMIPLTWLAMLVVERFRPARQWPALRLWRTRGLAFFAMLMAINALLPSLLAAESFGGHVFDGARLGVAGGAIAGFLAVSLVNALLHRAYHRYGLLWRWVHQLHHAPVRVDVPGAVVFSPLEIALNVIAFQAVTVFVLGLDPLAAALAGYLAAFYGMFQHFNVRTPRWLGWIIQRPESHCVHHRRGFHAWNYADFPLWDVLAGTFRNPREFRGDVGFDPRASQSLLATLGGRDANAALYGPENRGSADPSANPA